jgi:hypothetical protein
MHASAAQLLRLAFLNLVRSPLRHIPGPWYAALSPVWPVAVECTGQRPFFVHALHKRYGAVVRIGPNEVSFASADATRDIYAGVSVPAADAAGCNERDATAPKNPQLPGGGASARDAPAAAALVTKTFPKAPIYDIVRKSIGFFIDEAEHRERLRHVGPVFVPAALAPALEPVIRGTLVTLLAELEKRRGVEVDMLHWFRMFALDVIGKLH